MRRVMFALGLLLACAFLLLAGWAALGDWALLQRPPRPDSDVAKRDVGANRGGDDAEGSGLGPRLGGRGVSPDALTRDECGVFGRVLDAGTHQPVAGVRVLAMQWFDGHEPHLLGTAVSDAEGRYRVRGIGGDSSCVRLIACGGEYVSASAVPSPAYGAMRVCTVSVAPGLWAKHDVRVLAGAALRGTVLLPDGQPAAHAEVRPGRLRDETEATHVHFPWEVIPPATCDDRGRFAFDGLPPARGLGFVAALDGYVDAVGGADPLDVASALTLEIRFAPPRRLVLDVCGEDGARLLGEAAVEYGWEQVSGSESVVHEITATGGRIALPLLPPRSFWLRVEVEGFVPSGLGGEGVWDDVLRPAEDGLWTGEIVLERAAIITGRIERPEALEGTPLHVSVHTVDATDPDGYRHTVDVGPDGTFRVPTPRTGTYVLRLQAWGGRPALAEEVVEAGASGVVLRPVAEPAPVPEERPGRWARWRVTVLGTDGKPLPTADLSFIASYVGSERASRSGADLQPGDDGVVLFDVREGTSPGAWFVVSVWEPPPGYERGASAFGPFGPEGGEATVEMPERRPVEGRFLTPDGAPIQGAWLVAALAPLVGVPDKLIFLDGTWTDAEGRFVFRHLGLDRE